MPCGFLVACQGLVFLDTSAFGRLFMARNSGYNVF